MIVLETINILYIGGQTRKLQDTKDSYWIENVDDKAFFYFELRRREGNNKIQVVQINKQVISGIDRTFKKIN